MDAIQALHKVLKAYNEPGINPAWHRLEKEILHRNWPMLANALDELSEITNRGTGNANV